MTDRIRTLLFPVDTHGDELQRLRVLQRYQGPQLDPKSSAGTRLAPPSCPCSDLLGHRAFNTSRNMTQCTELLVRWKHCQTARSDSSTYWVKKKLFQITSIRKTLQNSRILPYLPTLGLSPRWRWLWLEEFRRNPEGRTATRRKGYTG